MIISIDTLNVLRHEPPALGNSLTSLSIVKVYELRVNILALVEYCPKLEFQILEESGAGDYLTTPLDEEQNVFKPVKKDLILENLKVLELYCDPYGEYDTSSECLNMLLYINT